MNKLACQINELLLNDPIVRDYLELKKQIEEDEELSCLYKQLNDMRKVICKNKDMDSSEYYSLLSQYNSDVRIKRFNLLKREIHSCFLEISDILSLK